MKTTMLQFGDGKKVCKFPFPINCSLLFSLNMLGTELKNFTIGDIKRPKQSRLIVPHKGFAILKL